MGSLCTSSRAEYTRVIGPLPCEGTQLIKHKSITAYLLPISAAKFFPARGVVLKPMAKFSVGRDVLHPLVRCGFFLRDPARPQNVDQNSGAVLGGRRLICPLQLDAASRAFRAHRFRTYVVRMMSQNSKKPNHPETFEQARSWVQNV